MVWQAMHWPLAPQRCPALHRLGLGHLAQERVDVGVRHGSGGVVGGGGGGSGRVRGGGGGGRRAPEAAAENRDR